MPLWVPPLQAYTPETVKSPLPVSVPLVCVTLAALTAPSIEKVSPLICIVPAPRKTSRPLHGPWC